MLKFFLILFLPILTFGQYYNSKTLDINNIQLTTNNIGSLNTRNLQLAYWNKLKTKNLPGIIVYQTGDILIGNYNNKRNLTFSNYQNLYTPGPIINGKSAIIDSPQDSNKYRVYKVTKNAPNEIDYLEWPIEFGAPSLTNGQPDFHGDQMLWTVFNSNDKSVYYIYPNQQKFINDISPMPIEIQKLTYANQNRYEDIVFFEYTFINKSNVVFKDVVYGFWTDIDFRHLFFNFPAVDTTLNLGYCWSDYYEYGIPPAVGFQLLYGPKKYSKGDEAIFKGNKLIDYKNINLISFHGVVDDAVPGPNGNIPETLDEIWNISKGLESDSSKIIDTRTKNSTKFYWSGDPVSNEGWNYKDDLNSTGGSAGFYMFTGPFDLATNDTQWVMMALIPALGKDHLESITKLKEKALLLKNTPYSELRKPSEGKLNYRSLIPFDFELSQNYPNPFNSITKINFNIPKDGNVKIEIYNSLGEKIKDITNKVYKAGYYSETFNSEGLSSGVYFYRIITPEFSQSKKMVLLK